MPALAQSSAGWQALLDLQFARSGEQTVLAKRTQRGPLAIQRLFYPEGKQAAHGYILHPPGGVVGGDELQLTVRVEPHAKVLLTTPGATKFYRSAGLQAQQLQQFYLQNAQLEWLPQETILFPKANAQLHTRIQVNPESQYIGWEIVSLGRPAVNESFAGGKALFQTQIYQGAKPLFLDRLVIQQERDLALSAGLRAQPVFATLLALPANLDVLNLARESCAQCTDGLAGATLFNGVLVVRYLGPSTAQAHQLFRHIWSQIRPLILGRTAQAPRIWTT